MQLLFNWLRFVNYCEYHIECSIESLSFYQDVFNTADPLPSEQLIQIYYNYLEEIEEDNNKRKLEDEEYEKRRQKLVSVIINYLNARYILFCFRVTIDVLLT